MSEERFTAEAIAKVYKVPYWLAGTEPKPGWLQRPIWRARAIWWRWFA